VHANQCDLAVNPRILGRVPDHFQERVVRFKHGARVSSYYNADDVRIRYRLEPHSVYETHIRSVGAGARMTELPDR
jgi:hypothetical protein